MQEKNLKVSVHAKNASIRGETVKSHNYTKNAHNKSRFFQVELWSLVLGWWMSIYKFWLLYMEAKMKGYCEKVLNNCLIQCRVIIELLNWTAHYRSSPFYKLRLWLPTCGLLIWTMGEVTFVFYIYILFENSFSTKNNSN